MKILAIGDIFGRPGRRAFRELLPSVVREVGAELVIANAENAAGGRGLTTRIADEILENPVHVLTAGNHIWEHEELRPSLESHPILRPHNVHASLPGKGWIIVPSSKNARIAVVCLQGIVFMDDKGPNGEDPFRAMDALLSHLSGRCDAVVVDFHAEATSEKRALAWYLDGRVAAVLGTHTHVQTADEEILPKGTAYISDLGMTGPHASVIGLEPSIAIHRFLTGDKRKFCVAEGGVRFEGAVVDIDIASGKALTIQRIKRCL